MSCELLMNLDRLHTTELGKLRIQKNLSLEVEDIVAWCKEQILSSKATITRAGKNWYIEVASGVITVNAYSYTIITAHKQKKIVNKKGKRSEEVIFTNMCMIYNHDEVLIQDKVNGDYAGITFPGGHVEKGESFTDAVIREVLEETGLQIKHPQLCGIKNWTQKDHSRYVVLLYKTNEYQGILRPSKEGEVYWISYEKLASMKLAEGMEKTLSVFMENGLSEQFFYQEAKQWKDVLK